MLIKLRAVEQSRAEIKRIADIFRGRILDVTETSYIVEMTGDAEKLDAFMKSVGKDNIIEVVRSGATGISRGEKSLRI